MKIGLINPVIYVRRENQIFYNLRYIYAVSRQKFSIYDYGIKHWLYISIFKKCIDSFKIRIFKTTFWKIPKESPTNYIQFLEHVLLLFVILNISYSIRYQYWSLTPLNIIFISYTIR